MGRESLQLFLRALNGGIVVSLFALAGELVRPKRFAGVFSAAPSVALANLLVAVLFMGHLEGERSSDGMVLGAAAMVTSIFVGIPLVMRLGAARGSALTCGIWLVTAGVLCRSVAVS